MGGLLNALRGLVIAGAVVLGLISLVGAAGAIGGAWSARLDVLAHFAPVWAGMGLAAAVIAFPLGSRLGGGLGVAGLGLALVLIVPEVLAALALPQGRLAAPDLKIVEFNLWGRNRDQDGTAAWILAQDADIVVLEEAFGGTERILAALRRHYAHVTPCRRSPCSSVIMSRQAPLASGDMVRLPGETHLSGSWATFDSPRGPFTVVGAHFTWPIPVGPQRMQRRVLLRSITPFNRRRLIIAGDFNTAPWSAAMRRLDRALEIPRYSRALPSWPAARFTRLNILFPFPFMPIDHVWAGRAWQVRVTRGPRLGSDHYPLVIQLSDGPGLNAEAVAPQP